MPGRGTLLSAIRFAGVKIGKRARRPITACAEWPGVVHSLPLNKVPVLSSPKKFSLATVAFAFAAASAHADWQYTHWGMSKDQVLLAANGALSPTSTRDPGNPYVGLRGTYATSDHSFDASLYFDAGDALASVMLSQRTAQECAKTLADLQSKYGTAQDVTTRRGPLQLIWSGAASGNRVRYSGIARADPPPVHDGHEVACTIVYAPLSKPVDGL